MTRKFPVRWSVLLLLLGIVAFALTGCGDDDNPTNPGGGDNDTFDQATASEQARLAVPQVVALVESIDTIGNGVDTAKDGTYQWNAGQQRWEYQYQWDYQGYQYTWNYTVQYLDGNGTPVMHRNDAVAAHHTMDGTGSYSFSDNGVNYQWTFSYDWDVMITGLHTMTYVMTGSGGYEGDYTGTIGGTSFDHHYVVTWETLDDGISKPVGGCPAGTIRYHFEPYYMDITFDGTSTATWTLKDGSGNTLDSDTVELSCGS